MSGQDANILARLANQVTPPTIDKSQILVLRRWALAVKDNRDPGSNRTTFAQIKWRLGNGDPPKYGWCAGVPLAATGAFSGTGLHGDNPTIVRIARRNPNAPSRSLSVLTLPK